jgi:mannose-6-phosphate isomerase-like protein (cupin superfamily)
MGDDDAHPRGVATEKEMSTRGTRLFMELSRISKGADFLRTGLPAKPVEYLLGVNGSQAPVEIAYFELTKDELHHHAEVYEYYLLVMGSMVLEVDGERVELQAGDVCCVFPGEVHNIVARSDDLKCFLVKYPHRPTDKIILQKNDITE